jgi:hypothetical protein
MSGDVLLLLLLVLLSNGFTPLNAGLNNKQLTECTYLKRLMLLPQKSEVSEYVTREFLQVPEGSTLYRVACFDGWHTIPSLLLGCAIYVRYHCLPKNCLQ